MRSGIVVTGSPVLDEIFDDRKVVAKRSGKNHWHSAFIRNTIAANSK